MKKYYFWLKALTLESFIFVLARFLSFFKKKDLKWVNFDNQIKNPILLIHGYLHNSVVWFYHGKKLKNKGFGPIYTISLKKPFSSIESQALEVDEKVKKIQEETKTSDLILIGHSMGGLIASYFALNIAKKNTVKDIITIATPFEGTKLAIFGLGKCAKEARRNSKFLSDLNKKLSEETEINFYNIASFTDQIIRPYTSAILQTNKDHQVWENNHYILNGIGHASLLYSKKVNDKISSWLS